MAKTKKVLPVPRVDFVGLAVIYYCDGNLKASKPSIEYEGGCWGGHGDGEYCYCPSVEVTAEVDCSCGNRHKFDILYT